MAADPRIRRFARHVGLAFTLGIALLWMISVPAISSKSLTITHETTVSHWSVMLGRIGWSFYVDSSADWGGSKARSRVNCLDTQRLGLPGREGLGLILPVVHSSSGWTHLTIPRWLVFLSVLVPTALLWIRDRRRIPPGHCPKCGYNLYLNASGQCPECGSKITGAPISSKS